MISCFALFLTLAFSLVPAQANKTDATPTSRFTTVAIYLDSSDNALAAYQLEFQATSSDVRIVGIEGGEHPAFSEPPYYDPKAIQQDRVILASFNTADADELPTGRTRVATIHLQITGDAQPHYTLELTAAADAQGQPIHVVAELQEPEQ